MDRLLAATVLLETVARGSISAAADHLCMSRSMATRYISLMEDWAGTRLLHRTTRKLSLTAAGEEILPVCKQMLSLSADVCAIGHQRQDIPRGQIRVSASSIFAEYCLTDAITSFLEIYPSITIELQIIDRIINLAEEGIDVAIRVTKDLDPGVIARGLGEVHSVICASPNYLIQHGTPVNVKDLCAHNCLGYAYHGRNVWHFRDEGEKIMVPVTGNFSSNEASVLVRAALNGTGIAMLPQFAANAYIEQGKLVKLLPDYEVESLCVFAVYLSRQGMSSALRTFITYLTENLKIS